jgi:hypothetical protein
VVAYLTLTLLAARWRYQAIRPYTEPLSCTTPSTCRDGHQYDSCYRRWGLVDTNGEAVVFAFLTGLAWPCVPLAIALGRFVSAGNRQLPEELAAEIKRLEAENEQLRQQQEGAL